MNQNERKVLEFLLKRYKQKLKTAELNGSSLADEYREKIKKIKEFLRGGKNEEKKESSD